MISYDFFVCFSTVPVIVPIYFSSIILCSSTRGMVYPRQQPSDKQWSQVRRLNTPPPPGIVVLLFITHRLQHSHCSSLFMEFCQLSLAYFPRRNQAKTQKKNMANRYAPTVNHQQKKSRPIYIHQRSTTSSRMTDDVHR